MKLIDKLVLEAILYCDPLVDHMGQRTKCLEEGLIMKTNNNIYKVDQKTCRQFILTVMDGNSHRPTAVLNFSTATGEQWSYLSLIPVSSWDKKEFAELLQNNKINLWVSEYQSYLAQQLMREVQA